MKVVTKISALIITACIMAIMARFILMVRPIDPIIFYCLSFIWVSFSIAILQNIPKAFKNV